MAISVEGALRRKQIIWGAPTYDQVRVGMKETMRAAAGVAKFNQSLMTADFPGGGSILYRSLDNPDNVRSHTADGVVIDESGDVQADAWYAVLRPMLMDTNGWAWLIGTPKGRNWYWKEHQEAKERADSAQWEVPTLGCAITPSGLVRVPHPLENPNIPFEEIQQLYRSMPERLFRQEILAQFVEDTGGVFRNVLACATGSLQEPTPQRLKAGTFVMGVDWAKSHDFTVLTVMDAATREVVAWDRFNQVDWHVQRSRLSTLAQTWHVQAILAEKNSIGDPNIEALQQEGLPVQPFVTTQATKAQGIEQLALDIETGNISYPPIQVLLDELQALEMHRTPSGLVQYRAPDGGHDDCVISLMLANLAASDSGAGMLTLDVDPFAMTHLEDVPPDNPDDPYRVFWSTPDDARPLKKRFDSSF